ncbi:ABC transporter substrate-binding protein [Endozoicomonas arenosclerae]|uniref:ABC transporter substrate-binding protein n=1 Tax=Endozoicomonas arenosclerae TaxID=1633495 RepID=UPI0007844891|nr:ABC transporter substrate-binding protein [Endozoicomonas arenosclerae]
MQLSTQLRTLLALFMLLSMPVGAMDIRLGWTPYAGSMAWPYASQAGLLEKWDEKYGVMTHVKACDDYMSCIQQFNTGILNAIAVTNVDALGQIAALGVDATIILIGSGSNGNDGIVLKEGKRVEDLRGKVIHLPMGTVSHFMLMCALTHHDMDENDVVMVNNPSSVVPAFDAWDVNAVVAWQPDLGEILATGKGNLVFDSSEIPGEIVDVLVVRTEDLRKSSNMGKALTAIWYEVMGHLKNDDPKVLDIMAAKSGLSLEDFKKQMQATTFYYTPDAALKEARSRGFKKVMSKVTQFWSMQKKRYQSQSRQAVGILFPDGATLGNRHNIKLRINSRFMKLAKENEL